MITLNNPSILRRLSHLCWQTLLKSSTLSSKKLDLSMKNFVDSKQYQKALQLFEEQSALRTSISVNMAIKACTELHDHKRGLRIIQHLSSDLLRNHFIQTSLIRFYMQCHDIDNVNRVFFAVANKSNFTYTVMFKGYISNKMPEKVLDLIDTMTISPDEHTLCLIFTACAHVNNERSKKIGYHLLNQMSNKFRNNVILLSSAISMLMSFGDVERAEQLFILLDKKNVVSYGAMMQGYIQNEMSDKALDLFEQMPLSPNDNIYTIIFKACTELANERAMNLGKRVLHQMLHTSATDNIALSSAIHMLMRFSDIGGAEHLFDLIKNKNVVSYGAMMQGYIQNEMSDKALDLFEQMPLSPDDHIYTLVFKACAELVNERAMNLGKKLLNQISNKSATVTVVSNSALYMLMKFGDIGGAQHLFDLIKNKDVISYGAMMQGYLENDMADKALDLFEQMSVHPNNIIHIITFKACAELANERAMNLGKKLLRQIQHTSTADNMVLSSAIHMLMRFGEVKTAEDLFESIKNKEISTYASMMKVYNLNKQPLKSLQLFDRIKQQNIVPDEMTYTLSISACSQLGMLEVCQSVVAQIPFDLHTKQRIYNALIDMWGKAGSAENAQQIFTSIKDPSMVTYTSMINAFGLNGRGLEAIHLFQQIPQHLRTEASYISVLNSCSHSGLLNEARLIFEQVSIKTKRITTTMIDCLSRLFLFDEAEKILAEYEKSYSPCISMYMAIMSGARNCRNSVLSQKIYNRMKILFPDEKNCLISASILLANIYSSLGDEDQVEAIQSNRKTNYGNKVEPGLSWTEKDGEIAEFRAHDHSHPLSNEIYDELKRIAGELIQHGHRFDPTWVTRSLRKGETIESVLCGHSEKLAIAFHFIRGRRPSFIQITKNLRICGDCHAATKLIAKIRQCDIVIRDANRIHHFSRNGTCSCQDHF